MATNHFKNAYDNVITLIKSSYSRFKQPGRIVIRDVLTLNETGYADGIMITPISDTLLGERVTGRDDQFVVELTYYKKYYPEIDYDDLTEMSENLIDLFNTNRHTTYWHYLGVESVEYSIEVPDDVEMQGFTMTLIIQQGKY